MGFNQSELWRIRRELGYPAVTIGALPYIDIVSIFEQVILPYTESGADTISTTVVDATSVPTLVRLDLQSAVGFNAYDKVFVDVDGMQEYATVQSADTTSIVLALQKAHGDAGSYPVIVDGGVAQARNLLRLIDTLTDQFQKAARRAGVKKVDNEIEFFESKKTGGSTMFDDLRMQREDARKELASVLGLQYLRDRGNAGNCHTTEMY